MYKILESRDRMKLETLVNQYLQDGYQLVGGVSMSITNATDFNRYKSIWYQQAVIKLEMKEEIECCAN